MKESKRIKWIERKFNSASSSLYCNHPLVFGRDKLFIFPFPYTYFRPLLGGSKKLFCCDSGAGKNHTSGKMIDLFIAIEYRLYPTQLTHSPLQWVFCFYWRQRWEHFLIYVLNETHLSKLQTFSARSFKINYKISK